MPNFMGLPRLLLTGILHDRGGGRQGWSTQCPRAGGLADTTEPSRRIASLETAVYRIQWPAQLSDSPHAAAFGKIADGNAFAPDRSGHNGAFGWAALRAAKVR